MDPKRKALSETVRHFATKGQFEQYSGLEAMRRMKFERQQHMKNREAEEAHVRKHVWGYEDKGNSEGEDVSDEFVNFGEINNQQLQPPRSILPAALIAGSLLMTGLGGIGAYLWQTPNEPAESTQMMDETVKLGLGRIEDYE